MKDLLGEAVERTHVQGVAVKYRPRLLSDNGSAFVSQ